MTKLIQMIMTSEGGKIVRTKSGKIGRTFYKKGLVNGKVPVYLATKFKEKPIKIPIEYSKAAVLCKAETLKVIGFID